MSPAEVVAFQSIAKSTWDRSGERSYLVDFDAFYAVAAG